jgi:hypothetical protein
MRKILTKLDSEELKKVADAQIKLQEDGNQLNFQKVLTQVMRSASLRIKKDVGELELLNDGSIVLRYERMTEHDLRVAILRELEMIREGVMFQANVLQGQLANIVAKQNGEQDATDTNPKEVEKK